MGRWTVKRDDSFPRRWAATNTGDLSEVERFSTHEAALDYADKKARTREVVLPRIRRVEEMHLAVWQDQFGMPCTAISQGATEHYNLAPGHIAGIGCYFLALADLVARRQREANDKAVSK